MIHREVADGLERLWNVRVNCIWEADESSRHGEVYIFDHVFKQECTNSDVYGSVVKPLVDSFMEGFNATIFAYGQTSSGKTHTILGNKTDPGLFQLVSNQLFQHVADQVDKRYLIRCSYIEIYNEKINDLLDKSNQGLTIREDIKGNVLLDAREAVVDNVDKVMENMMQGNKIRRVAATRMNERSSRSHTIFRIILESKDANQKDGPVHISYLNLMDLAGSERVSLTKAAGERLKEGANINKSLSVLGNVIRQLSEGKEFISYRDSKLTRLLSQALGDPGLFQLVSNQLFQHVADQVDKRYLIRFSYIEIYNEKINDLLDKSNQGLTIREDIKRNVLLDAREAVVDNVDQVMENMMQGNKIRRVAATRMNERSSRSHTIFRIILESKDANQKDGPVHISYLNLMDLAGSERVSLTKAAGERLEEGANINKSLSVLGNVIRNVQIQMYMEGFNATIFAYGQTSSGKTHTILGNKTDPGLFQLVSNQLFQHVADQVDKRYLIRFSYIEIYNEKINDLLDKSNQGLTIREDIKGNVLLDAREAVVDNVDQVMENMMQGNKIRRVAATRMNERSSRSHTIFRIILESKDANQKDGPVHISYLNLMDLAGSERVSLTKAAGEHLKEGANINKSLSVLGNVIRQLSEGKEFISYRDSKLTRLLSQALGGNVLLDAREAVVDNVDKVMENMMQGNKIRRVAATRMNERSSRSHTIFRIILESKDANQKDGPVHIGYLNSMDLAGSERVSLTKAAGEHLKEGANINKSLSVLGNVIRNVQIQMYMEGFNATIFAYGQTSSGKTHTILGNKTDPGLFQLVSNQLFQHVADQVDKRYLIRFSYIEIYNEKINDLLDKSNQGLTIREDIKGNVLLDAREAVVDNVDQVMENMMQGNKIRRVAATRMNERSSRSHTIFRIILESKDANQKDGPVHISYLNLMDLAGSERVSLTKAAGEHLKEGANINKSLSVLGNVIRQLSEGKEFISYRDSKLTRLLSQALGDVYGSVVKPLVDSFMEGFNATIFAYGQTSSGKTHTILGNKTDPGLFQLVSNQLFQHVADQVDKRYLIRFSYIEIYNEKINDLLDKSNQGLTIREDIKGNVLFDAREAVVDNVDQVMENMM
ncbi:unnamed protein product [Acanthoscelides obtectus]|uniref:Kinesin motor domain-containing protein n=1 Tax=Acanthoscelides obtectus TaxID=200917 RepID=A0A9P0QCI5_ACAOB|nr:unnamed protein product [Acanthoscelides obtectus]CAK1689414.1 Kinesin-like protein KIN-7I [Acanthoscelides obtectus]